MPFHIIKISYTIAGMPRYRQYISSVHLCSLKHTGENGNNRKKENGFFDNFKFFIFETFATAKSTILGKKSMEGACLHVRVYDILAFGLFFYILVGLA
jgi:hypothetical protein